MMDSMAKKQEEFMQSFLNAESSDSSEEDTTDEDDTSDENFPISSHTGGDDAAPKPMDVSVDMQVPSATTTPKHKSSAKARLPDCILCQEVCFLRKIASSLSQRCNHAL